ncbi:MAG TPA: hypothetical protein VET30_09150 [Pseudoxanthomonas sp.]|nr:hypothetical protein [Pseudoxanthomonas sp.]
MTQADFGVHVMGVLALELSGGSTPGASALPQAQAGQLVELLARDLGKLVPGATALDLSFAAAHFDPAEVLRPGWPLHRRLDELRQRAPGREQGPRVIAFGADNQGNVPLPFIAEAGLQGGQMRVLPFLLSGEIHTLQTVGERMEEVLLETGMAQADTALLAQQAFGAKIEHARYLTVHDLAAMVAMQYANEGLQALWPIIETALMAPGDEAWLDAPPEPLLRYASGEAHIALFEPQTWRDRYAPGTTDDDKLERAYRYFQARQQQLAAVLEAHGIAVTFAYCSGSEDVRDSLCA